MSSKLYPKELGIFARKFKLIPSLVKSKSEIRKYGKYMSVQQATEGFKVEDIIEVNDDIYYQIRFLSSGRQAVVPYEDKFTYYTLFNDINNIRRLPTIINTDKAYFGSEIKYWFFINNIDLNSEKFINFKSLIMDSKHFIADNKMYYLKGNYLPLEDKYVSCCAMLLKQ